VELPKVSQPQPQPSRPQVDDRGRLPAHHRYQEKELTRSPPWWRLKVAYADFVTAMMALFIVLWLLNTSKPVRERVVVAVSKDDMTKLKEELEKAISQMPNFDKLKNQIEIKITPEGLRTARIRQRHVFQSWKQRPKRER
jgi:flagellar motor protein MotB